MDQKLAGRPLVVGGGYRGRPRVVMSYDKHSADQDLLSWQEEL